MDLKIMEEVFMNLFLLVAFISFLLLVGTLLRAKIKVFQKLFLPASVLGGFIGLLLGPIVLKDYAILNISQEWITLASLLPGFLIVPVVASVPLGIEMGKKDKGKEKNKGQVLNMFLILAIIGMIQSISGHFVATIFRKSYDLYPSFGTELLGGFTGGHGTAGVIGNLLRGADQPFWEVAQGITTTSATVGLVGGILVGIVLINIMIRKNETRVIKDLNDLPDDMETGIIKVNDEKEISGYETTNSSSIDSLSFHISIVMIVSGLAYVLVYLLKKYNVLILSSIPQWAYAILIMYAVWFMMIKLKMDHLVDTKTKSKISSTLTEFAVVAAIISLPLDSLFAYLVPMILMLVLGFVLTVVFSLILSKKIFKEDYWFERSIAMFGTNTGVFLTGILLLKMVDPNLDSPVLKDYSISYSINSIIGFVMIPLTFSLLIKESFMSVWLLYIVITAIYSGILWIRNRGVE